MSAVVQALSEEGNNVPNENLNVETVFKEAEPEKKLLEGGTLPFLKKHQKSIFRLFIIFLYYMVGCLYYNANMEWDALECIYFITVSSKFMIDNFWQNVVNSATLMLWFTVTTVGYGDYTPDNNGMSSVLYIDMGY